ncbi:MAG: 5-formyltetrahydrofolate cyclo-ligase [Chromatiales bacterium]|nr:5-formyltetrahydrofolate cyclo-ligase [Chromatiales bacterium]
MSSAPVPASPAPPLRAELRRRRLEAPADSRELASRQIARRCWQLPALARPAALAAYLPMPGEVDCLWLIRAAWFRGREVLVPVLAGKRLRFAPLSPDTRLQPNRFGIPEPCVSSSELRNPRDLPVVITPLLGFDADCNRLGMGGGFYDRSFSFRLRHREWNRPQLIGIAFDLQQVEQLPTQAHDVRLDAVVTESRTLLRHSSRQ